MCGIFGVVNYNLDEERAFQCLQTIQHRGPDGWGLYRNEGITLGHRRLSILDLSEDGKQPMKYQNGRYVITYNGEIYNFLELRKELQVEGYTFKSDTDTEVILAAYLKWGKNCLTHFNGMWAFAIWDNAEKILFMSRDRFGVKPLYYTFLNNKKENAIGFASEMKALVPILPSVSINYGLLERNGIMGYEATEECVIKEIKRFPAGSYGYFQDGKLEIHRWWNTLDYLPQIPDSYEEQTELFRELFVDACKIRMRSDVRIGTALSGGIDSSATICTMAAISGMKISERINSDWQHAFVATFPETTLDESVYAKKVTDFLGINSIFVEINPENIVRDFERYLYLFEEIYLTTPIPMIELYRKVKEAGVVVTIDGHGADELFCGYYSDFLAGFPDAKLNIKRIKEILQVYSNNFMHDGSNISIKNVDKHYGIYTRYMLNYHVKSVLHRLYIYKAFDKKHYNWKRLGYMNKMLYMHTHQDILPTLLRNYDHYSMASGVEIRMPFLDHRIVTFAFALSDKAKLRNGYSKAIVRDGLACYMPEEIVRRKTKIGFGTPLVEWMQGALREFFLDTISSVDFTNSNLIDSKKVRLKILNVLQDKEATFFQAEDAYREICPYLWEKYFFKKACNMIY